VRARVWGSRGSIATPGPETARYGGNTSCIEVRLADDTLVVLDAGTGARPLGIRLAAEASPRSTIHLLLSHLHVDHVEGLGAFAPIWMSDTELHVWGPASPLTSLERRIARYFSPPLFPVHLSEVPARVTFHDAPEGSWTIGGATLTSAPILHAGPTVGYRIQEDGRALTYLTDHEPAKGSDLSRVAPEWISGYALAFATDVLVHDCQYTEEEYPDHVGWGHSSTAHLATFAERAGVDRLFTFHHDPMHEDGALEGMRDRVRDLWGVSDGRCAIAAEGLEFEV
jgi:phosphoribosyl 1,2-cyclic phosphodiesterase